MEQKINWYRTPIDKEVMRGLTERSDARGLLQAGSFLLIFAGDRLPVLVLLRPRLVGPDGRRRLPRLRLPRVRRHAGGGARAEPRHALQDQVAERDLLQPVLLPFLEQPGPLPRQPHAAPPVHAAPGAGQGGHPEEAGLQRAGRRQLVSLRLGLVQDDRVPHDRAFLRQGRRGLLLLGPPVPGRGQAPAADVHAGRGSSCSGTWR